MLKGWAFCSLVLVSAACLAARPDRNAFVDYRIVTVADLERQIKTDPAVADRYERHFAMTKAQLLAYVSTLHRATLAQDKTFTVYSVPVDGHVKMHMQRYKAGEPIFADPSGNPILLLKCGNPLTLGPEEANAYATPGVEAAPSNGEVDNLRVTGIPGVLSENTGSPNMLISSPPPPGDLTFTPEAPETLTSGGLPPASAPESFGGGGAGGGGGLGILPFIPIAGGIIYGIGSSGGHHPLPTPEPMSFLVLGFGVGGLMIRRSKNRSRLAA